MKRILPLVAVGFLVSCNAYRKVPFQYEEGGVVKTVKVVVPKGYRSERTEKDSAGNTVQRFRYRSDALFYVAHMKDTSVQLQPIIESMNIPRQSLTTGALVYKGMDPDDEYWREVRQGPFRVGYRDVSKKLEHRFDSATNYPLVWPMNVVR